MGSAGEIAEEGGGFAAGGGFAEDAVAEGDLGVGAQDKILRKPGGDGAGLGGGVGEADFAGSEVTVGGGKLGHRGDGDAEGDAELPEEVASSWRRRCEDEAGRGHGLEGARGPEEASLGVAGAAGVAADGGDAGWVRIFSSSAAQRAASFSFLSTLARVCRRS